MHQRTCVDLDRASHAALRVLTADGTSVDDAVRAAITEAGERFPEPPVHEGLPMENPAYEEWIAAQVAAAPPPSEYTLYVVNAAFAERRETWLSKEQWLTDRDGEQDE